MLVLLGTAGCKKSDDDTTKPSLSGLALDSDASSFMPENTVVHVKANIDDLITSDDTTPEAVGIYYMVNGGDRDTLTTNVRLSNPTYTVQLGEAGVYTIYCYAYAGDDYYSTSTTQSITVVNPETAIKGLSGEAGTEVGGHLYHTMEAQGKTWMGNNLYGTGTGKYYSNSEVLSSVFGHYYTWEEAQSACPDGWHLPSAAEFDECLGNKSGALMANADFIDVTMWEYWPAVVISNNTAFNAIPVGYMDFTYPDSPEGGYKEYACFWTADEKDGLGLFRYIYKESDTVQKGQGSKQSLAMSVRCVKD